MALFVFRNYTVERFFPKDYVFSGYDDISVIPSEVDGYVWFYQTPIGYLRGAVAQEIQGFLERFDYILERIDRNKTIIALTMDWMYSVPFTDDDYVVQQAVGEYNAHLFEAEKSHSNLKVLDYSDFSRNYPATVLLDWKFFFISQMGINPKLTRDFRAWWDHKMDGLALKRKKCIVLDLDNTLWGGVLGEDGIGGIKIGGDYPGKAFLFFQESLLELSKSGVLLAVCSKNNEADVLEAWEKNPFMVLRKDDFAAYRINWADKATNIRELADELNIGMDSFVFVDDNPTERELVRQMLPMVSVPEFPAQPYDLPFFFQGMVDSYFRVYSITEEDKKKTEQYKALAARSREQASFRDFESFLDSLDLQLTIEPADEFNIPRIAQMTQKTNQFNLTSRRYTDSEIKDFLVKGWKIWCLSVADRFGDSGITGVVMVNADEIDTFLLSCRILGKGIENAFFQCIVALLKESGLRSIRASYIPTPKNVQVSDFYDRCGMTCVINQTDGVKKYLADIERLDLTIKKYYQVMLWRFLIF